MMKMKKIDIAAIDAARRGTARAQSTRWCGRRFAALSADLRPIS
jgi:hypothetical protein